MKAARLRAGRRPDRNDAEEPSEPSQLSELSKSSKLAEPSELSEPSEPSERSERSEPSELSELSWTAVATAPRETTEPAERQPFYPRLLRLRHVHPNAWQRAALGEGSVFAGGLLALADVATAWSVLALPLAVAVVVKSHDLVAGLLERSSAGTDEPADGTEPA